MIKKIIIACLLMMNISLAHDAEVHSDDPVKQKEHLAALKLVDHHRAIDVYGKSSDYIFAPTDDLYISEGSEFIINQDLDVHRIRVDGTLRITTGLVNIRFETLISNTTGHISIPSSNNLRTITIKARGTRDRIGDPTDISGGIILHSKDNIIAGSPKTSWVTPTKIDPLTKTIHVNEYKNWKVGDQLLIPRVRWEDQDELVTISLIRPVGEIVVSSLQTDHKLPDGTYVGVGNLTRNLVITSESTELSQRGHVMIMHEHTGTTISDTAFINLGRTSVESIPTKIVLDSEGRFVSGDENTIGRYPLHAHGRSGANVSDLPHQFVGNVVRGSPSHGITNHGSHVSIRNNIVYDCFGSNLFGENGLELGDFTKNLAVLAKGRQTTATLPDLAAFNFGWEGYCLWLQGPGMTAVDNELYGAKKALFGVDFTMLPDGGGQFDYPVSYIPDGPHKAEILAGRFGSSKIKVGLHQVPAFWSGNRGAGASIGLNMVHIQYDTKSPGDGLIHTKIYTEKTKIHNFRMFNVDTGIGDTYIGHLDFRNCRFDGNLKLTNWWRPYNGSPAGTKVHNISMDNCEFRRFQVGIVDRGWSDYIINNCTFEDNLIDIQVITRSNILNTHEVHISNCKHLGRVNMLALYASKNPAAIWGKPKNFWFHELWPLNGKAYSMQSYLNSPHTLDGKLMYYPDNEDSYVPFLGSASPYDGKSNAQTWTSFGKAINGRRFSKTDSNMIQMNIDSNIPVWTNK